MQDPPKLGELLPATERRRDCVHVAIAPVTATQVLLPGKRVRLVPGSLDRVEATDDEDGIGIIDPFLTAPVRREERCWLLLFPGTITSLRHIWTSPAFTVASREALS